MTSTVQRSEPGTNVGGPRQLTARLARGAQRPALGGGRRPTRSWGLVTFAALLVVGSGLAVAAWGLNAGDRESVLAIGTPVAEGETIERADLVSVSVAGVSAPVPVGDIDTVAGKTAAADLVVGQVLTSALLTEAMVPSSGSAAVGLALDPNRVPGSGLAPGDVVDLVAVPPLDAGASDADLETPLVLSSSAEVLAVDSAPAVGGQQLLTVLVDDSEASRIAAYSAQGRVAVVEVGPSGPETTGAGGS